MARLLRYMCKRRWGNSSRSLAHQINVRRLSYESRGRDRLIPRHSQINGRAHGPRITDLYNLTWSHSALSSRSTYTSVLKRTNRTYCCDIWLLQIGNRADSSRLNPSQCMRRIKLIVNQLGPPIFYTSSWIPSEINNQSITHTRSCIMRSVRSVAMSHVGQMVKLANNYLVSLPLWSLFEYINNLNTLDIRCATSMGGWIPNMWRAKGSV